MCAVLYPASRNTDDRVWYSVLKRVTLCAIRALLCGGPFSFKEDSSTMRSRWHPGVVMPTRAGHNPVMMLARVGEHSGLAAYALVNIMPRSARASMFGVLQNALPYNDVSRQPRSSARMNNTFGFLLGIRSLYFRLYQFLLGFRQLADRRRRAMLLFQWHPPGSGCENGQPVDPRCCRRG